MYQLLKNCNLLVCSSGEINCRNKENICMCIYVYYIFIRERMEGLREVVVMSEL